MRALTTLAPLALTLFLCPAFGQGLEQVPAPPQIRQIGVAQGEQIGKRMTSANVYVKQQPKITVIEFAYEGELEIALIQTTPEVLQLAIGMIQPEQAELITSLFMEQGDGSVVGVTFSQKHVDDSSPFAKLSPQAVREMLEAFERVTGSTDGEGNAKLAAASVDWRASDADEHSSAATVLQATPSTEGTYGAYSQLLRTSFSFAQGYDVQTKPNGDLRASRPIMDTPRGFNAVELREDGRGGGVMGMGYSTRVLRQMKTYLHELMLELEETPAAEAIKPSPKQPTGVMIVDPNDEASIAELLEEASK